MAHGRKPYGRISNAVFASVIQAYMASDKYLKLEPSTKRTYRRFLLLAEHKNTLGAIPVEEMRPALVQAFLDGLADRPAAQQKAKTVMQAVERFAIVRDLLAGSITAGTEAPGSDGGYTPWSEEQVAFAERSVSPHLSCVITMAANTGQRGSDLVRMRWTDIEEVDCRPGINVVQKKTGLKIWVPFTQALIDTMSTWEKRPGFILTKPDGHPFTRPQLTDAWLREMERPEMAPLKGLVLHGLRGTAVVRLRRAGVSIAQICDVVGMSPQMVTRYCRFSDQKANALAAMDKLEGTKVVKFPSKISN